MASSPFGPPGQNPYQSPAGAPGEWTASASPNQLATPKAIETLRQTRPWVRFISVLGFIGSALMIGIGLLGGLMGTLSPQARAQSAVLFVYVPLSLLYIFPSLFLWRYADRIHKLQQSQHVADMESALEAQKSFWRFIGIVAAIILAIYAVLLVVMVPLMLLVNRG